MENERQEGDTWDMPVSQAVITQQASATIKSLTEAIVELETNSDDSYKRLEEEGRGTQGQIAIHVQRQKGGQCQKLVVQDYAAGMDLATLEKVMEFGADTSGFFEGRSVRGLLGKGLKEAVLALGEGTVRSSNSGKENEIKLWLERPSGRYKCQLLRRLRDTTERDGTIVEISVSNEKIKSPTFEGLFDSVCRHFALQDIHSNPSRVVTLLLDDASLKRQKRVSYTPPLGKLVVNRQISVPDLGITDVQIYESEEKLDFDPLLPWSDAGIRICTERTVLDNQLFKFSNDEAAKYFFGRLSCQGIANAIRARNYGLLNPSRAGLDWRERLCKNLKDELESIIQPLVERKRRELQTTPTTPVKEQFREKLRNLCSFLNSLAKTELEELPGAGRELKDLRMLAIRPDVAYGEPNEPRLFTLYVPKSILDDQGPAQPTVTLADVDGKVQVVDTSPRLTPHPVYSELFSGPFGVVGRGVGDSASVIATLGPHQDIAYFVVKRGTDGRHRGRRPTKPRAGGLFKDIDFDDKTTDPTQRAFFDENKGKIVIYLKFPPIANYLKAGGAGMDQPQGSLILAELVNESFCRYLARKRLESGVVVSASGGGEIDAFNAESNRLMKKFLADIHSALVV